MDILDELSDIIQEDACTSFPRTQYYAAQPPFRHERDDRIELDDFDRHLLSSTKDPTEPRFSGNFANYMEGGTAGPPILERASGFTAINAQPQLKNGKGIDLSQFAFKGRRDARTPQIKSTSSSSYFDSSPTPMPDIDPFATGVSIVKPVSRPPFSSQQQQPARQNSEQRLTLPRKTERQTAPVCQGIPLLSLDRLPDRFRPVFPYPFFNAVQSRCFPAVYESNDNLVVSAPTGSGKTAILELAICNLLMARKQGSYKIIYLAPTKALCSEKRNHWEKKFRDLGLVCTELTGDTSQAQIANVRKGDIIVTTPEKWDSMTRRWEDHSKLLDLVRLFLIDEVHILEESRGAVLEVIVSRMKTIGSDVRFVALSATVPNSGDIASWLGRNCDIPEMAAHEERFGPEFRPVKLEKYVYGYPSSANDFSFDKFLDQKLPPLILQHSAGKPFMVFCMTRNICVSTAKLIADVWTKWSAREKLWRAPKDRIDFVDKDLQATGSCGVAFHHAGLDTRDRQAVEDMFLRNQLTVICCTSTLAVGVNLPAHLVIIKNTVTWSDNGTKEYVDLEIMQMLGRAGRPQFDDSGVAVIMTRKGKEERYKQMEDANKTLESCLHMNLVEHMNAEIGLKTIANMNTAKQWLRSTFLAVRLAKNPHHYQLNDGINSARNSDRRLENICEREIDILTTHRLINNSNGSLCCTAYGKSMARYYIRFPTMCTLMKAGRGSKISQLLEIMSEADEYKELRFRQGEKGLYKELNKSHGIRFPLKVDPSLPSHKVYILTQFELGALEFPNEQNFQKFKLSVNQDKGTVFKHSHRIISCLMDCLIEKQDGISTRNAMELSRSLQAKVWENSANELRQLEGLGPVAVKKLIIAGASCIADLSKWPPSRIENAVSRNPPFGASILKAIKMIPDFELSLGQVGNGEPRSDGYKIKVRAEVRYLNEKVPARFRGMALYANLLLERSDGFLVENVKIPISQMAGSKTMNMTVCLTDRNQSVLCLLACEQLVGTTKTATLAPNVPSGYTFPVAAGPTDIAKAYSGVKNEVSDDEYFGGDDYEAVFDQIDFDEIEAHKKARSTESSFVAKLAAASPVSKTATQPTRTLTAEPVQLSNGNWACRHKCGDKTKCKHMCCREGLDRPPRPGKPVDSGTGDAAKADIPASAMASGQSGVFDNPTAKNGRLPASNVSSKNGNGSRTSNTTESRVINRAGIMTIDLAGSPTTDLDLSNLRALHARNVPETGVHSLSSKPRKPSVAKNRTLQRQMVSSSPKRESDGYNPFRRPSEVYNAEIRDLDDVFDDGLFNMTTPAPVSNLGPNEVSHSGNGKRPTSPEQLETPITLKKTRHKSPIPEVTPGRGPVPLFPENPSFMIPSSSPAPNDFNSEGTMQVAPVAKMYGNEVHPSVGIATKVVGGNPVEEEDTINLLDFLQDCVQFEDI